VSVHLTAEVCASALVMAVMLATPRSEVECKTTGYPLHSHVSPSLPLPCVTVCHQVSTELYVVSTINPHIYIKNTTHTIYCMVELSNVNWKRFTF